MPDWYTPGAMPAKDISFEASLNDISDKDGHSGYRTDAGWK
jgi:hypothetical protein